MVRIEKWLKFFIIVGSVSAVVVSVLSLIDIKREVREKIAAAEITILEAEDTIRNGKEGREYRIIRRMGE
ncbi:TPA: hypothetical protein DEW47_03395 [Patescibacteria group bacterium]|nr:MAG: hypothetical protein UT71_C0001G0019 [Parcubacteria group bacterium GW2011_GWF2_40_10]KKR47897.1 MAG: hypothetical protein UT83_C0002G0028 [Parcubacteria group bacterium GW2011_GWA2_40_143]KKR60345.1 MAG: hypothetical protein UT97_C0002G0045 [Parcubacteria group bacterium GW2011_GWC2_40_31]KKR75149.1 MAG: hypothetical protein UU18_C0013G0009 [Parcubacteria group bacterium GW2011_GWB2_40_8]KKR76716.1 MAG: hypothetical protein UU20_C0020G0014 [Parcubacteria group bacterium GW2011_GWE2_40_